VPTLAQLVDDLRADRTGGPNTVTFI